MSMGIGWPNASAQATPPTYVYFTINSFCNGGIPEAATTQAILEGTYSSGDYVYSTTVGSRALLGAIAPEPGKTIYNVSGQVYPDCEE